MKKIIQLLLALLCCNLTFTCASTKRKRTSLLRLETNQSATDYFKRFYALTASDNDDNDLLALHMFKARPIDLVNKRQSKKAFKLAIDNLGIIFFPDDIYNAIQDYITTRIIFDKKITARLKEYVFQDRKKDRECYFLSYCALYSERSAWLLRYLIEEVGLNINTKRPVGKNIIPRLFF